MFGYLGITTRNYRDSSEYLPDLSKKDTIGRKYICVSGMFYPVQRNTTMYVSSDHIGNVCIAAVTLHRLENNEVISDAEFDIPRSL